MLATTTHTLQVTRKTHLQAALFGGEFTLFATLVQDAQVPHAEGYTHRWRKYRATVMGPTTERTWTITRNDFCRVWEIRSETGGIITTCRNLRNLFAHLVYFTTHAE